MSFLNNFNKWRHWKKPNKMLRYFFIKHLNLGLRQKAGRNNSGKITFFYRGGGHKRNYRLVDLLRNNTFFWNIPALVFSIEYDPNRSCNIALILYANGFLSYILATDSLKLGDVLTLGDSMDFSEGDRMPAILFEIGTKVNNVSYWSRSAGCYSKLLAFLKLSKTFVISLPSGVKKLIHFDSLATLGCLSNALLFNRQYYKAGQSRWLSKRPHVRGVAKNPIDHPMGGGQGKTSGGRVSVTPWGIYTKGYKTKRKLHEKKKKQRLSFY